MTRLPIIAAMTTEADDLEDGDTEAERNRFDGGRARERRQQHENNDGEHVLHDEPPDRDMTRAGVKLAAVREHANQDDGARDGER